MAFFYFLIHIKVILTTISKEGMLINKVCASLKILYRLFSQAFT
ncbi:hypothetical protein AMTRI_Chr02g220230 [Amborella trichopoda]